jgi:two-component system response regulator FixJ
MSDAGNVHIVDDDAAVRCSLTVLLAAHGMEVRAYETGAALLEAVPLVPGCMILDLRMPGMDGLALLDALRERGCLLPALIVSGHADVRAAVGAMKAGAVDVIEKPYSEPAILHAVREALALTGTGAETRPADPAAAARLAGLTPRERDVLRGMVSGLPNKAIGLQLGISPRTVEIHRANLMEKLACRSLAEAVRLGLLAGIDGELDLPD